MDFAEMKRLLNAAAKDELNALADERDLQIDLDAETAAVLLFALQRAYHHSDGEVRAVAERIGRGIQDMYCRPGTVLGTFAEAAWEDDRAQIKVWWRYRVPEAFRLAFRDEGGA